MKSAQGAARIARCAGVTGVAVAVALSMGVLVGCGSDEPAADTGSAAPVQQATQQEEKPVESDYAVSIDGCTVTTDYQGAPAVVIDYTFTNNSDEDKAFAWACSPKAFQNGVQLETAIVSEDLGNGYTAEVKPGATTQARVAYALSDQSDVTVEVTELISLDDAVLAEATFAVA